jgi:hypothetical protein
VENEELRIRAERGNFSSLLLLLAISRQKDFGDRRRYLPHWDSIVEWHSPLESFLFSSCRRDRGCSLAMLLVALLLAQFGLVLAWPAILPTSPACTARLDVLRSLGLEIRQGERRVTAARLVEAVQAVEASGSYITRTELECLLGERCDRERLRHELSSLAPPAKSFSLMALEESLAEGYNDQERNLHLFRRNVALRQNRVLMPARAAQLYAAAINACIIVHDWETAARWGVTHHVACVMPTLSSCSQSFDDRDRFFTGRVLQYVGLTPRQYYDGGEGGSGRLDLNSLGYIVGQGMLDLDLESMEWGALSHEQRKGPAPLKPK